MNSLQDVILVSHIAAGFVGLLTSVIAIVTKLFELKHSWHVKFGRVFFWAMIYVSISAIPLSIFGDNLFLFLIALFSGYLAHGGWRYAKNKKREKRFVDKASIGAAIVVGLAMLVYGLVSLGSEQSNGITLAVFGLILSGFAVSEIKVFSQDGFDNKQRVAMHLSLMIGSAISAFTAFVVTNFTFDPAFVIWLGPTVVLTPIIIYMNTKVLSGKA